MVVLLEGALIVLASMLQLFCYAVEEFVCLRYNRDYVTCTDKLNPWNSLQNLKFDPRQPKDIPFKIKEKKKTARQVSLKIRLQNGHPPQGLGSISPVSSVKCTQELKKDSKA